MNPPTSPAFEILDDDGGWLTAEGIAVAGTLNPESVLRSMARWEGKGLVETRSVGLTGLESRREWRVTIGHTRRVA